MTLRVISLGAGVQSTAMVLMAGRGVLGPMPDCAIFADTGWEPRAVYDHLAWLQSPGVLPFPIYIVSNGNIRTDLLARRNTTGGRFAAIPFFTVNPNGSHGMGRRQCTNEYKLVPLMRKCRELLGVAPRARIPAGTVEMWVGISTDEAARMKPARQKWQTIRWPLIEAGLSRTNCDQWTMANYRRRAPKSACIGCPFHNNAMWRQQRDEAPAEHVDAVLVDQQMRLRPAGKFKGVEYMHAQRVPLDQVDLSTAEERGQGNLFINECEGMCGL